MNKQALLCLGIKKNTLLNNPKIADQDARD